MLALGVTGDVGAGKSTLTRLWGEMGASVIDADHIVRDLWLRPSVVAGAVSLWGKEILDEEGRVRPSAVASIAFGSREEYRRLNGLIHPLVRIEMNRRASCLEGWVVAEIPLLFETGPPEWVDVSVYVTSPERARIERNAFRGWTPGEIERREAFLLSSREKKKRADIVIENDGDLGALTEKAQEMAASFRRQADLLWCSANFDRQEEALLHKDRLCRSRLALDFCITSHDGAAGGIQTVRMTFITRGSLLPRLGLPGDGVIALPVRRMTYSRRAALSEGLLP